MNCSDFIGMAIAAAPATPKGLADLRTRVTVAEAALQEARRAYGAVDASEQEASAKRAAVNDSIAAVNRDLKGLRAAISKAVIVSIETPTPELVELSGRRRALLEREIALHDALDALSEESLTISVREIEAQITVTQKARGWVEAAGVSEIAALYQSMLTVLKADPSISFELLAGSKAQQYTNSVNTHTVELAQLREQLKRVTALARANEDTQ